MKWKVNFLLYRTAYCDYLRVSVFCEIAPQNLKIFWYTDDLKREAKMDYLISICSNFSRII